MKTIKVKQYEHGMLKLINIKDTNQYENIIIHL